jgi:hypothetical protein
LTRCRSAVHSVRRTRALNCPDTPWTGGLEAARVLERAAVLDCQVE